MAKKVLLVDDSKTSRMMMRDIIEKLGHEIVSEAENGELGFEAYKELKPDVVFSDVEMPVLDGPGMLEKILAYDSNALVVVITAVANAQIVQKIKSVGAKVIFKKPIKEEELKKFFDRLA